MALNTSVVTALVVVALILAVIISAAIWQFCARKHDFVQRNTGDTIRFTLNGRRTTEQIEYMKHVRDRNLIMAWEESRRHKHARPGAGSEETILEYDDRYEDEDEEHVGMANVVDHHYLVPPTQPWMKQGLRLKNSSSSIYSSNSSGKESTRSKAASLVEEWENEHGGFSGYLGMKTPSREAAWV